MPGPEDAFRRALLQARRHYREDLLPSLRRRLALEYLEMMENVTGRVLRSELSERRARVLRRQIEAEIMRLVPELAAVLAAHVDAVVERTVEAVEEATEAAMEEAGVSISFQLGVVPTEVVRTMMQRRQLGLATTFRTLYRRRVAYAAEQVDRLLTRAVATGLSAEQAATELAGLLAHGDPDLRAVVRTVRGRTGRILRFAMREEGRQRGLEEKRLNMLFYDARRITVTEINTAHFEAARMSAERSPVVELLRWSLSGRHQAIPGLAPDICDLYARLNAHGYGPGLYHPAACPPLPHPHCMCHTDFVLRPVEAWDTPKRPLPDVNAPTKADVDRLLRSVGPSGVDQATITDRLVSRLARTTSANLDAARAVATSALITR